MFKESEGYGPEAIARLDSGLKAIENMGDIRPVFKEEYNPKHKQD